MAFLVIVLGLAVLVMTNVLYRYTAFFAYHFQKRRVKIIKDVPYVSGSDNPKHKLDVYLPKNAKNFPIIHFIYGGYWTSGDKNHRQWLTGLYGNIGVTLAEQGVGVVISNYRLIRIFPKPGLRVTIQDQIDDVAAAVNWTLKHASEWGSNGYLYMMGHSAGAHIISLFAANSKLFTNANPKRISGYIALSPILDVEAMATDHDDIFNHKVSFPVFGEEKSAWQKYSPLQQFIKNHPDVTKLLLTVGENDFKFLRQNVPESFRQIKASGIGATLHTLRGYNHTDSVVRIGSKKDQITPLILDFINH